MGLRAEGKCELGDAKESDSGGIPPREGLGGSHSGGCDWSYGRIDDREEMLVCRETRVSAWERDVGMVFGNSLRWMN